jgi:hypothetical protein
MMFDDDTLMPLLRINDELLQLCKWLNENATWKLHPPYTARRRPYPHSDRSWQKQITLTQPYKGYFIEGSALMVHPFSPDWYVGGTVLVPARSNSIVRFTRFQLQQFTVSIKELAEWFGVAGVRHSFQAVAREGMKNRSSPRGRCQGPF